MRLGDGFGRLRGRWNLGLRSFSGFNGQILASIGTLGDRIRGGDGILGSLGVVRAPAGWPSTPEHWHTERMPETRNGAVVVAPASAKSFPTTPPVGPPITSRWKEIGGRAPQFLDAVRNVAAVVPGPTLEEQEAVLEAERARVVPYEQAFPSPVQAEVPIRDSGGSYARVRFIPR